MKKYVCKVCGYIYEGDSLPEDFKCPVCKAPAKAFTEVEGEIKLAAEHEFGVYASTVKNNEDIPDDVKKTIFDQLVSNFNGECSEVGMYLCMARVAHRAGYPEIGLYWEKAAFEEAEHAAKFAELLGSDLEANMTNDTTKNLAWRVDCEYGATQGKTDLAKLAKKYNLSTAEKKDSTGVCFIGERNFRKFLSEYIPMKDGEIRDLNGKVVGTHHGVYYYTIGQRKGLGIGGGGNGEAWFVVSKDVQKNILYVSQGDQSMIYHRVLECDSFNYITYKPQEDSFRCTVRIRHRQPEQAATAFIKGDGMKIVFDNPQRAIAEGQYAVVYVQDVCLGGGVIERKYNENI